MKFKCNTSGCVYNFESALDIKAMRLSQDYTEVREVPPPVMPVKPTTVVPVAPVKPVPDKPLPVVPAAPKAI